MNTITWLLVLAIFNSISSFHIPPFKNIAVYQKSATFSPLISDVLKNNPSSPKVVFSDFERFKYSHWFDVLFIVDKLPELFVSERKSKDKNLST